MSEESLAQTGRLQKQNLHLLRGVKKKKEKTQSDFVRLQNETIGVISWFHDFHHFKGFDIRRRSFFYQSNKQSQQ